MEIHSDNKGIREISNIAILEKIECDLIKFNLNHKNMIPVHITFQRCRENYSHFYIIYKPEIRSIINTDQIFLFLNDYDQKLDEKKEDYILKQIITLRKDVYLDFTLNCNIMHEKIKTIRFIDENARREFLELWKKEVISLIKEYSTKKHKL